RSDVADDQGTRRYLLADEGDPVLVRELVQLLGRNDVEVRRLTAEAELSEVRDREGNAVGRRTFAVGTYVVEAAQPAVRVVRTLLEPATPITEEFLAEARTRALRAENPRFYDITAWSLPLLFNVGGYSTTDGRALETELVSPPPTPGVGGGAGEWPLAEYAYVLDGRSSGSLAMLYHLRQAGHRAGVLTAPSRIAGRDIPGGSVIVRIGQNDETVHDAVQTLARRYGVEVWALETGLGDVGYPSLGSGDHTFNVAVPEIAMLGESPVFGYSFGWAWYTLDRQHEIPVTVLRVESVGSADLAQYSAIVVPAVSGEALERELGDAGMERLARWVRDGGTLVTIGAATDFAREQLDLVTLESWYDTSQGEEAQDFDVPGAIVRVTLDDGYWMASGYDAGELPVLVDSDRLYLAPEGPPSSRRRVVGRYASADPLISGHAWPESLERMPDKVFLYEERVGGGRVIAFAEDPNYRGYFRGANRLFLNAVVLGPSAP
ncbi:MAG: hypothetical protein PVF27_07040, partial [Gemmatimonadales bacterium]